MNLNMGSPECSTKTVREGELSAWKILYQSAILEMDAAVVMQRIAEAEKAIVERALALREESPSDHVKELGALAYSANFLAELRRLETSRRAGNLPEDAIR
jgi:hypothetical protein